MKLLDFSFDNVAHFTSVDFIPLSHWLYEIITMETCACLSIINTMPNMLTLLLMLFDFAMSTSLDLDPLDNYCALALQHYIVLFYCFDQILLKETLKG